MKNQYIILLAAFLFAFAVQAQDISPQATPETPPPAAAAPLIPSPEENSIPQATAEEQGLTSPAQAAPTASKPAQATEAQAVDPLVFSQGAQFPSDVLGWQSARWGMTIDELLSAVPKAKAIKRRQPFGRPTEMITHMIDDYMIGNAKYKVYFIFGTARPYNLVAVQLVFSAELTAYKANFAEIQRALVQKYGPPVTTTALEDDSAGYYYANKKSTDWVFPSTTISLSQIKGSGLLAQRTTIMIDYRGSTRKSGIAAGL